jgi:hypothetical protein
VKFAAPEVRGLKVFLVHDLPVVNSS